MLRFFLHIGRFFDSVWGWMLWPFRLVIFIPLYLLFSPLSSMTRSKNHFNEMVVYYSALYVMVSGVVILFLGINFAPFFYPITPSRAFLSGMMLLFILTIGWLLCTRFVHNGLTSITNYAKVNIMPAKPPPLPPVEKPAPAAKPLPEQPKARIASRNIAREVSDEQKLAGLSPELRRLMNIPD